MKFRFLAHLGMLYCTVLVLCGATTLVSASVKFKNLVSFDGSNGQNPVETTLVQGIDGELYGTTEYGGVKNNGNGTVFKISSSGTLTTLWSFCTENNCPDGDKPMAGLTLVIGGDLYGTTFGGGAHNSGTVFKITPSGELTTIYNFCSRSGCADGLNPNAGFALIQGTDGNFYGSTSNTFFRLTPAGKLTTLYTYPSFAVQYPTGVLQASDGNFYMTVSGGTGQNGFILKITPAGKATTLYSFCSQTNCADGSKPGGPLVQGANGNFYGTAAFGGKYGNGTFFELTLAGKLTTLHSFDYETAGNLGSQPNSGVILGADSNFYGVAELGGEVCVNGCGTVFKMTPAGVLTTLHEFTGSPAQGYIPWGIAEATTGVLFGDTNQGGPDDIGTVYSVSDGLAPFVELVTNYGQVGKTIDILGQGFTGATGVSFDGVAAKYDNVSDTYMTAVVPDGALTGTVTVTTFTDTYKSSKIFLVTPQLTGFTKSGIVGSTVTLTGVSLTQTTSVTIGGEAATFKVVSDTEVTATVPDLAKTGEKIIVTTLGGTATIGPFAIPPFVGPFSPTKGPVGTEVKITGTTFTHASKVTFGGVSATSFEVINDSQVDAIVPKGGKTGHIEVTTPGGTGTSKGIFTVTQ